VKPLWLPVALALATVTLVVARPAMFYEKPPVRFRGPFTTNLLVLSSVEAVGAACKANGIYPTPGCYLVSCYVPRTNTIIAPTPCGGAWGLYGELLCHEGGHAQGWSAEHER